MIYAQRSGSQEYEVCRDGESCAPIATVHDQPRDGEALRYAELFARAEPVETAAREAQRLFDLALGTCRGTRITIHRTRAQQAASALTAALAPDTAGPAAESPVWVCGSRRVVTDPPQECDWPFCGCDPHANKVLEVLGDLGLLMPTTAKGVEALERAVDDETKINALEGERDILADELNAIRGLALDRGWSADEDSLPDWLEEHVR